MRGRERRTSNSGRFAEEEKEEKKGDGERGAQKAGERGIEIKIW